MLTVGDVASVPSSSVAWSSRTGASSWWCSPSFTSVENSHCCGQTFYTDGGADAVLRGDDVWGWNDEAITEKFAAFSA